MNNISFTKEFFLMAVNSKGDIPALKSTEIYASVFAGCMVELLNTGLISKTYSGKFQIEREFDENYKHLFPLYEKIDAFDKPISTERLFERKSLDNIIKKFREMLVSMDYKEELTHQGIFKNKTKYVTRPEVVIDIVKKIRRQFFGEEELQQETICLVALLNISGLLRDYFGKLDAKLLKKQLKELPKSPSYALAKEVIGYITVMLSIGVPI